MKPIDIKHIDKSSKHINSLLLSEKLNECDMIHQAQPHAFLTVLSLSQDGVSMEKVEHALHVLMVIHKIFTDDSGRKIPLITKSMLDEELERNVSMLQVIEDGLLSTDESLKRYFEIHVLAYVFGYLQENKLNSPCEEHERLLLNVMTVFGSYANARKIAEHTH